jgi:hypothetical protein
MSVPKSLVTARELLNGVRDANFHDGGIRCLRILRMHARCFEQLKAEVVLLCEREQPSDVRASEHVTNWTRPRGDVRQYSLLNASGRANDFSGDHDLSSFGKRLHVGADYPMLTALLETFPDIVNVRINALGPGARLAAHEEHSIIRTGHGTIGACLRYHLPVVTNAGAELTLDGDVFHLEESSIYLVNHGCVHAVRNSGQTARLHLVWDQLLTRNAYEAMFGNGCDPEWGTRVCDDKNPPRPLRTERMGAFIRLPPPVTREEAEHLDLCEVQ